jgi:hypothetical protein
MSTKEEMITSTRCPKCNADVRDGSVFCYNCGGRVTSDDGTESSTEASSATTEPVTTPAPGLRTARDIRRRERTFQRKPREVVWEPSSGVPDIQLIVVTAIVIVFTIAVILMALYLR